MNNSAVKTLKILQFISKSKESLGVSQIAVNLGYPKSTVFDIIEALLSEGFIEFDNSTLKTYKVGMKAYQIGCKYINDINLYKISHEILDKISRQTGYTTYLAIENDGSITYLDKVEGDFPIRLTCNVGSQNYMHNTGLGKAILATYSNEKVKFLTENKLIKRTRNTITNYKQLVEELELTRKRGYALDSGEDIEILRCVAAPIYDGTNNVIAAISISILDVNFTEDIKQQAITLITEAGFEISQKMGYLKDKLYIGMDVFYEN